jgi:hypothetical protein
LREIFKLFVIPTVISSPTLYFGLSVKTMMPGTSEYGVVTVGVTLAELYEIVGKTVNVGAGVVMLPFEDGCELIHPDDMQKIRAMIIGKIL